MCRTMRPTPAGGSRSNWSRSGNARTPRPNSLPRTPRPRPTFRSAVRSKASPAGPDYRCRRRGVPSPPSRHGPDSTTARHGLTARELDVLRLLGTGATNAEIGRRLYMSPKTASVHVSAIIRKLGVNGRVQAATVAERMGLLEHE